MCDWYNILRFTFPVFGQIENMWLKQNPPSPFLPFRFKAPEERFFRHSNSYFHLNGLRVGVFLRSPSKNFRCLPLGLQVCRTKYKGYPWWLNGFSICSLNLLFYSFCSYGGWFLAYLFILTYSQPRKFAEKSSRQIVCKLNRYTLNVL